MELEKMEFSYKSKIFSGSTTLSKRLDFDNKTVIESAIDLKIQNAGLLNIFNLRGSQRSSIFRKNVQGILNIEMPNRTGFFETNEKNYLLQTSPDEWLILSDSNEILPQINELEKKLIKTHFALTNLTDQFQAIYISGDKSRWVLSKGCHIDLDQSVFGPKNCTQTNLALVDITIFCTAKNSFTLLFRNSFANYVLDWLQDASFDCNYQFKSGHPPDHFS